MRAWLLALGVESVMSPSGEEVRVVAITSSDCRSVSFDTHRESGTQFAASLVSLLHVKHTFPEWDAAFVSIRSKWGPECRDVFDTFAELYAKRTGETLRVVDVDPQRYRVLDMLGRTHGKEGDHSRGHWPVDAYVHLIVAEPMHAMGYDYTVYVDPDVLFLDKSLADELWNVQGIGCISAIPPECLVNSTPAHLQKMHDEYRLVADDALLASVRKAAEPFGGYTVRNSTNSGLVIYNNNFLAGIGWSAWLATLFDISNKGFYGDQTALTVAYGRNDVHVHWLPSRHNVALTFPRSYVQSTCGDDATYSLYAALPDASHRVSSVHFIWGPKPWMAQMNRPHRLRSAAVQADLKFVNRYRSFVHDALPSAIRARLFQEHAFALFNTTTPHFAMDAYARCKAHPRPCGAR